MPGEYTKSACIEADAVIRDMAARWSDEHVAAMLNRMRLTTGQGLSWSAKRSRVHYVARKRVGLFDPSRRGIDRAIDHLRRERPVERTRDCRCA